jgi:phosphohistidine swiveling domain-containing protein
MKKKTIISLCLITVVRFACFAQTLVAEDNGVTPYAIVTFSSGMPKVAGTTNKYNPYTIASVGMSEQLSVSDGSTKVYNIN